MKKLLLATALVFVGSMAQASFGYTEDMSCTSVQSIVSQNGAVILYVNENIYDRYVSNGSYCRSDEVTEPAWLPTRDNSACFVGYTCAHHHSTHGN